MVVLVNSVKCLRYEFEIMQIVLYPHISENYVFTVK